MVRGMECLPLREASFTKKRTKWPHGTSFLATPATLAEAGFYYSPAPGDKDNVACYMCDKNMGEWEEEDNPFLLHWEKCGKNGKCAWATVRCSQDLEFTHKSQFSDPERYPTSVTLENARLETFLVGGGWPHDDSKNHGASSRKMASAGFVHAPVEPGHDLAACLYCQISLDGWDRDDDPIEEHRRRRPSCVFLQFLDERQHPPSSKASSTKPSTSRTRTHHRNVSRSQQDMVMPTKTFDGSDMDEDSTPPLSIATTTASTKTPARNRRTTTKTPRTVRKTATKTPSRKKSRTDDDESDVVEPVSTKGRGRSRRVVTDTDDSDALEPPPTEKKRRGRGRSVAQSETDDGPVSAVPQTLRPRRTRAKSAAPPESEAEAEAPPTAKKRRGKSKPPIDSESEVPSAPETKRRGKKYIDLEEPKGPSRRTGNASTTRQRAPSGVSSRVQSDVDDVKPTIRHPPVSESRRSNRAHSVPRGRSISPDVPRDDDVLEDIAIPLPINDEPAKPLVPPPGKQSRAPSVVPSDGSNLLSQKPTRTTRVRSRSVVRSAKPAVSHKSSAEDDGSSEAFAPVPKEADSLDKDKESRQAPEFPAHTSSRRVVSDSLREHSSRSSRPPSRTTRSRQASKSRVVEDGDALMASIPQLQTTEQPSDSAVDIMNDDDEMLRKHLPDSPEVGTTSPMNIEFPPIEAPPPVAAASLRPLSRPPSRSTRSSSRPPPASRTTSTGPIDVVEILSDEEVGGEGSSRTIAPGTRVLKRTSRIRTDDSGASQRKTSGQLTREQAVSEKEEEKKRQEKEAEERLTRERERAMAEEREERELLRQEEGRRELEKKARESRQKEERLRKEREEKERRQKQREEMEERKRKERDEQAYRERVEREQRDKEELETRLRQQREDEARRQRMEREMAEQRELEEREYRKKQERARRDQEERERRERLEREEAERERLRRQTEEQLAKVKEEEKRRKESLRRREDQLRRDREEFEQERRRLEEDRRADEQRRQDERLDWERRQEEARQREEEKRQAEAEEQKRRDEEARELARREQEEQARLIDLQRRQEAHEQVQAHMDVDTENVAQSPNPVTPPRQIKQLPRSYNAADARGASQLVLQPRTVNSPHYPASLRTAQDGDSTKTSSQVVAQSEESLEPLERQFFPPLSSEPFENLTDLPEGELEMSVEEWIRYQMERELEKFKKDALAEIARFTLEAASRRAYIERLEVV